ncbi:hypothetical protein [Lysinibacillus sp. F5]|uniref:hypothetical protein n=1 Tax=Lysinibacillus sp. F5 TaxID=1700846 RepID=UPI000738AAA8|nr:hypothetical protein [Lysinibacillus sp. F5]KUF37427.1 hypothetical protein AK833_00625 [Lysinibacillus sp. F5]
MEQRELQLYQLKFNTAQMTVETIRDMYTTMPPANEELEALLKAYHNLHGNEFLGLCFGYASDSWSIHTWNDENDDAIRDFVYQIEQDEMFGTYHDAREEFLSKWANGEYEPSASWHIPKAFVEVIEPFNNLERAKEQIVEGLIAMERLDDNKNLHTYVIERDLTDDQAKQLQQLFLADENNNAVEIRKSEQGRWEAVY